MLLSLKTQYERTKSFVHINTVMCQALGFIHIIFTKHNKNRLEKLLP